MVISIGYVQGVYAETIYSSGKWSLDKNEMGLCTASTMASIDEAEYMLKLTKDLDQPIQITILEAGSSELTDIMLMELGEELVAVGAIAKAKEDREFWHVPNNAGHLVKYIKAKSRLTFESLVSEDEEANKVVFSLRGSSNTLRRLEKECNDGLKLENDVLLNALEYKEINPESLSAAKIKKLNTQYVKAFEALVSLESSEVELVELEKMFADDLSTKDKLVKKEKKLEALIPELIAEQKKLNVSIPKNKKALKANQNKLPRLQSNKKAAVDKYNKINDELGPMIREHDSIVASIESYRLQISVDESDVDSLRSSREFKKRELNSVKSDIDSMRSTLDRLRAERDRATDDHQRVLERKRNFNVRERVRNRLSNNSEFQRLKSEIENLKAQTRQLNGQIKNISSRHTQARKDFRECKKQEGADCSAERKKVDDLNAKLGQKRRELIDVEKKLDRKQNRRKRIRENIEDKVNSRYNEISSKEERARSVLNDAQDRLADQRGRKQSLQNEADNLRDDISDLSSDLDDKLNDLDRSRDDYASAKDSLISFKQRTNFEGKKRELVATEEAYNKAYWALDAVEKEVERLSTSVRRGERRLASAVKDEASAKEDLVEVKASLKEVNLSLKEYDASKAKIDKALVANQKKVETSIATYKKSL